MTGLIMEWPCPSVRPSTIACEWDILKKTSDAIDLGHSTKTKMATTAV